MICDIFLISIWQNLIHINELYDYLALPLLQYMEDAEFLDLLNSVSSLSTSPNWAIRHGAMLTLSSMSMYSPSLICQSPLFPSLIKYNLKNAFDDDKVWFLLPKLLCSDSVIHSNFSILLWNSSLSVKLQPRQLEDF